MGRRTSVSSECIHELAPESCSYCKVKIYTGPHWDAAYPGDCCICGVRIETGDRIRWSYDGTEVQHSKHK